MNKLLVIAAVIILAAGAAYLYMESPMAGTADSALSGADTAPAGDYVWTFTDLGEDPSDGAPHTKVEVIAGGTKYDLGSYHGSCTRISESSWEFLENEIDGAICWWAGGGQELGVFREGNAFVIKMGNLDEGSAETPAFRGGFQTIINLN